MIKICYNNYGGKKMNNFNKISVKIMLLLIITLNMYLIGCSSKIQMKGSKYEEELIETTQEDKPKWIYKEPEKIKDKMIFVGLSGNYATEQSSRDDAYRNSINKVMTFMGTLAKNKYEKAMTTFGLSSAVVNPTESLRNYEKHIIENIAHQIKPIEWYVEKWRTKSGIAYRTYVMCGIPVEALNESFKESADLSLKDAEKKVKETSDQIAIDQTKKAVEFWKNIKESGLIE